MKNTMTVAIGQFDVRIFEKDYNIQNMVNMTKEAKRVYKADLAVFPECALTGYCFNSLDEVRSVAEDLSGPSVKRMSNLSKEEQISIAFGFIESDHDKLFNCAVLCEPDGEIYYYHKVHLPFLGADRFVDKGDDISVMETSFGKAGFIICYDLRFPEISRVVSLQGARIIIQPTNYPQGAEAQLDYIISARACENRVFLLSANRTGEERGTKFIGRSQVVDISGSVIAEMGEQEGILAVTVDLARAEQKDIINEPNNYELYLYKHRRPELYNTITEIYD